MAGQRVYLNRQFHDALDDFRWLADDISSRPTRIGEIVPEAPTEFGRVDASGQGMGGVWIDDDGGLYDAAVDPATLAPDRGHGRGQAVADVAGASAATAGFAPHITEDLSRDCRSPRCEQCPLPEVVKALAPVPPTDGWQLQVRPSAHGRRKRLYDQLGRRPRSWVSSGCPLLR